MTKTLIQFFTDNTARMGGRSTLLVLSGLTLFLRFPFFFRDYIDRDESTFILLGQSWANGQLPYTELWDLKPPVTFLYFALFIYSFGKSFFAIRLGGTIMVAAIAFFTYLTATTISTQKIARQAGFGCVLLLSLFGSLQGVMSEHISMFFFMPGLYLLLAKKGTPWFLLSGLLLGLSVMTKINLAYPILAVVLYLFFVPKKNGGNAKKFLDILFLGMGISFIISLTVLPYYTNGITEVWWRSVVLAPLEYTGARRYPFIRFLPISLFLATLFYYLLKRNILDHRSRKIQILVLSITAILFSFIKGGRINGHYLIQLHPMLIIFVVMALNAIRQLKKEELKPYFLALLFLIPVESYWEYVNIIKHKMEKGTLYNGEGFSVPKYIQDNGLQTDHILFLGYHIGYWVLDKNPPTKAATHPSNLCRDELFQFYGNPRTTSVEELRYIMETLRPKTVVVRNNRSIFDKKEVDENAYMDAYLAQHYKVVATVEKAAILQRL
jgi:hypothetical protein